MLATSKAYVLHTRRYTDTKLLVDFLTREQGLVRVVARASGKRNSSAYQSFQPREIRWGGKSDLKTLHFCETTEGRANRLTGETLYCGLYLNELLIRVLPLHDPCPEIFERYQLLLDDLYAVPPGGLAPLLRDMEFFLLKSLGFELDFAVCAESGEPVQPQAVYGFSALRGFYPLDVEPQADSLKFFGHQLLRVAAGDYSDPEALRVAKIISRMAFAPLLGDKPLKSRELFQSLFK